MLRALFITRQPAGGTVFYARNLAQQLESRGMEAVVDDCSSWIPDRTGWQVDRPVSKMLREAAKGFDVVVAFGYRSAWACAEAFYLKRPWVYIAYDTPRTTHNQLIDRLSSARAGICASRTTKRILDDADGVNLTIVVPGVPDPPADVPDKAAAREQLGIRDDARFVVAMGRPVADTGLDAFDELGPMLREDVPRFEGMILPIGGTMTPKTLRLAPEGTDPWALLSAADVVLVPARRAGFSMTAGMAMKLGKPVLARDLNALREIGVRDVSMEFFEDGDDAFYKLMDMLAAPTYLESLGAAARTRANDYLSMDRCGKEMYALLKEVITRS